MGWSSFIVSELEHSQTGVCYRVAGTLYLPSKCAKDVNDQDRSSRGRDLLPLASQYPGWNHAGMAAKD